MLALRTVASGSTEVFAPADLLGPGDDSAHAHAVAAPLIVDGVGGGSVLVVTGEPSAGLVRATTEVTLGVQPAEDAGNECVVTIEDDGVGEDPDRVRSALADASRSDSVGSATPTITCARCTAMSTGS